MKLEQMLTDLSESQQKRQQMETELAQLQESSKSEISQLYDRLEDKTKAGWWYCISRVNCIHPAVCTVSFTSGAVVYGFGG